VKILLLGSGAREHALARALVADPATTELVVVPGNLPAADGSHSLYCAVIIKQVDEKTRSKTGINELLRS